ncbi:MAG: glycoside hydrolase family 3 C-terminal domain-containing protein [Oscillospiraceae bacterium]|nr:glycoside hydrolase family 3 C-terminal domain-containing protein [Oscillospiraceae bacterium]
MNIPEIISKLTLEEKAGLCSGADFWHTKAVERLGIPSIMVSDGPHGLRKQEETTDNLGINESIKAVCFPAGCATASSFDRELIRRMGEAIGNECQAEDIAVILGPAVNIKRSPLCGRNFEYFSEDPLVAGEMAAAFIQGVQSRNIGTSIKHFYANSQEHRRMSSSSNIDKRTAREIYMTAFEKAVKEARPWTVMCSYNKINGTYAADDKNALTDILRGEWGFDGFVMSDWGAVSDRCTSLEAGTDLEMPSSFGFRDRQIADAVREGRLPEKILDNAVERILTIAERYINNRDEKAVFDLEADHELARKIASECMVLLKNEDCILPLDKKADVAFIGAFAENPRFQGGGSSHINAWKTESALSYAAEKGLNVSYCQGYDPLENESDPALIAEAVSLAEKSGAVVIFAGLPDSFESEGFDRSHMRMPDCQNELIEAVAKANPNTIVVLHNGSPVEMPWVSKVKGILEAYLGGQAVGGAAVDILFGDVNPSGHLAETFPVKLEDNPSFLSFPGEGNTAEYREGVFVGYRYYSAKKMPVLFPFGHGLSYTTFEISGITADSSVYTDKDKVSVSLSVKNTGSRSGKAVIQLYVMPETKCEFVIRPPMELKAFDKIYLEPGETKQVSFTLDRRAFAYYDAEAEDWQVPTGYYTLAAGLSSAELTAKTTIHIEGRNFIPKEITPDTLFGDILRINGAMDIIKPYLKAFGLDAGTSDDGAMGGGTAEMIDSMMKYMPVRNLLPFGGGDVDCSDCLELIEKLRDLLEKQ